MSAEKLFHISDNPRIKIFEPLPAHFYANVIMGKVVFAISGKMLHNYLLPRNCPRVTFYAGPGTTEADKQQFFGTSTADYVVCVETAWYERIQQAILYCYEFAPDTFTLFDECVGYYISYEPVIPLAVKPLYNLIGSMLERNVELRFMPSITELGEQVKRSSLQFSLIRMHFAKANHL